MHTCRRFASTVLGMPPEEETEWNDVLDLSEIPGVTEEVNSLALLCRGMYLMNASTSYFSSNM